MLGSFLRRWRSERDLRRYVSPERVKAIAKGRELAAENIHSGKIEFIFALVRAVTPEMLSAHVNVVADLAHDKGAVLHHIVGSLIVIAFGTFPGDASSPELRRTLVSGLRDRLDHDVKILHGSVHAHFGNLGSARRISWTFVFPEFDQALAKIGGLEFGQTEEFTA